MTVLWRRLATLRRLGFSFSLLMLEATIFMVIAKIALTLFSFRRVAGLMGSLGAVSPKEDLDVYHLLARIKLSIEVVAKCIPGNTKCYVRSLTTKLMLDRRHQLSTLYIGLLKTKTGEVKGHAWLRCGKFVFDGNTYTGQYQTIATYS